MESEGKEEKPIIQSKSSMEILSELFSTFHAEPPVIIKQENSSESKKHKKKKKKHKSKDKKHKKKSKKRKRSCSINDDESADNDTSSELGFDLATLLVKQEKHLNEDKIKIEGTEISLSLDKIKESLPEPEEEDVKPSIKKVKIDPTESKTEEGEISSDHEKKTRLKSKKHKSKHKHKKDRLKQKSDLSKEKVKDPKIIENKVKYRHKSKSGDATQYKDKEELNPFYRNTINDDSRSDNRRSRSPQRYSTSKHKEMYEYREYRNDERHSRHHSSHDRSNDFYEPRGERNYDNNDFYKPRSRSFERNRDERWHSKRSWDHSKDRKYKNRGWSPENELLSHIDKKKLLEIARKNAIQMMKSGSLPGALTLGPQAQEKVIAAIKAGGKTIEELTDFCKTLSKKEDLGELSDVEDDRGSESDNEKPFNHPFQIKDRPTTITMNIKNSVPLPVKSTQERTTELRMQFPVSSGQHHRKNENEWVPVEPKKGSIPPTKASITLTKEIVPLTPLVPPTNSDPFLSTIPVPPTVSTKEAQQQMSIDISSIVSQRLTAMRKLQENPHDVQALSQMYKSTKEVQSWAESKQQPGQFTGSVGGHFLSQSELSSGFQAWAKKDQLQVAAPVSGGMGMHLLQKMGWKPGEGLGKEKTGALEPLLLEVKLDKRGLVATEESQKKRKQAKPQQSNPKNAQGKHPVSLLGEYACKNKLGAPAYELCFECGPDHKKNFLFKVLLNGMEFKPNVASPNKKEAKANAASLCLQKLGIIC